MRRVVVLALAGASALSLAVGVRAPRGDRGFQDGEASLYANPGGGRVADRDGPPKRPRALDRCGEGPRRLEGRVLVALVLWVMRVVAVVVTW